MKCAAHACTLMQIDMHTGRYVYTCICVHAHVYRHANKHVYDKLPFSTHFEEDKQELHFGAGPRAKQTSPHTLTPQTYTLIQGT